jgi:hypothetical protein
MNHSTTTAANQGKYYLCLSSLYEEGYPSGYSRRKAGSSRDNGIANRFPRFLEPKLGIYTRASQRKSLKGSHGKQFTLIAVETQNSEMQMKIGRSSWVHPMVDGSMMVMSGGDLCNPLALVSLTFFFHVVVPLLGDSPVSPNPF